MFSKLRHVTLLAGSLLISMSIHAYDNLDAFTGTKDINTLLTIWGEEANSNANNSYYGKDRVAPIFNSSYDWHSSVHAHFASVYAGKELNKTNLVDSITQKYDYYSVRGELNFKPVYDEKMYGYPWLLIYADYLADVEPQTYQALLPLINRVYQRAYAKLYNVSYSAYSRSVSSGYKNYNFLALGVYTYAKHINDQARMSAAKNLVASYAPYINWSTVGSGDFFAPKAIALWAYETMGITGNAKQKIVNAYNSTTNLVPNSLTSHGAHGKGKVMSSAWGFWLMYQETKQQKYLDAYVKAVNLVYQELKNTRYDSNYFLNTGHWVPHFGVIAVKIAKDNPVANTEPVNPVGPTPVDPKPVEPVLISDIVVSPAVFTSYVDIEFPVTQNNTVVKFEVFNWANRVVKSKRFYSKKGNQKARFEGLSGLWAEDYTLKVTIGNKVFKQPIQKKASSTWWWW